MNKQSCYIFLAAALSLVAVDSLQAQPYQKQEDGARLVSGEKQARSAVITTPPDGIR